MKRGLILQMELDGHPGFGVRWSRCNTNAYPSTADYWLNMQ